ncbi:MAG: TonB-dependent receptor [Myxococcota bacterium]
MTRCFVVLMLMAIAAPAVADVRTEARRHFRRGMQLIQSGEVDAGIAELEIAYETLPHPNVLYNIGRAYAESGRYEEAIDYFEQYLSFAPPDREEVEGFLNALRSRLQAREAPPPAEDPEPAVVAPTAAEVTPDEILAIEESATQIEALAEATDSESLRQRAARLRALAESLRSRAPTEPTAETPPEEEEEVPPEGENLEALDQREEDVYEEQVVSASRFAESPLDAPNSTHIITRQDIRLTGLTNISELLRRVAGVDVMTHYAGQSDVSIRGLNRRQANKVLVLVDGRTVRLDFLAAPWVQMLPFNVEDIERIEVIRGPAAAVYGADAFSGIVNIILRTPGEGESYAGVSGGSRNTGRAVASVSARTGRLRLRVSGGYERTDNFATVVDPAREDVLVTPLVDNPDLAIQRTSFSGELQLDLGRGFTLHGGSSVAFGDGAVQGTSRLRQVGVRDVTFAQTHLTLQSPWGLKLRSYWNRFAMDLDPWENPDGSLQRPGLVETDVVDTELSFNRELTLGIPQNIAIGVGHRFKGVRWNWFSEDQTEQHFFAYIQDALQLHDTLRLTLSFRVDRHPLLDRPQFSPRGSLVWRFTEGNALRVTAGTAFRSPALLESYLDIENRTPVRGVTAFGRGNQNLDPERIVSFEIGYANQATDFFALEANVYYNLVFDEIQLSSVDTFTLADFGSGAAAYDEDTAAFPVGTLQYNNEDATFRQLGAELGIRVFPVDGLDLYANYAFNDTAPVDESDFQDSVRGDDQRTSQHKLNVGAQYRAPFGLDLSADLHWISDQVWVEQVTDAARGVRFESFPLDGYILVNARIGYRLFDDALELGLVGTNLTFQKTRQHPFSQPVDTRILGTAILRF